MSRIGAMGGPAGGAASANERHGDTVLFTPQLSRSIAEGIAAAVGAPAHFAAGAFADSTTGQLTASAWTCVPEPLGGAWMYWKDGVQGQGGRIQLGGTAAAPLRLVSESPLAPPAAAVAGAAAAAAAVRSLRFDKLRCVQGSACCQRAWQTRLEIELSLLGCIRSLVTCPPLFLSRAALRRSGASLARCRSPLAWLSRTRKSIPMVA